MSLTSMTGFARADGSADGVVWHWEVRTVNGRGLDVRVRLPAGFEALEQDVRKACAKAFRRGNCTANLNARRDTGALGVRLNQEVLRQVVAAAEQVRAISPGDPPRIDGLLAIKGVLETVEPAEDQPAVKERHGRILASLAAALGEVGAARRAEGARLGEVLSFQIDEVARLVEACAGLAVNQPEAIRARIERQVARLGAAAPELEEARLHQEAMLVALKADIQEELERLRAHIAAARELLASEEAVGRRLDFLTQEFNREVNTICSKSYDGELTRLGLELKAAIDQIREQVQNIE